PRWCQKVDKWEIAMGGACRGQSRAPMPPRSRTAPTARSLSRHSAIWAALHPPRGPSVAAARPMDVAPAARLDRRRADQLFQLVLAARRANRRGRFADPLQDFESMIATQATIVEERHGHGLVSRK